MAINFELNIYCDDDNYSLYGIANPKNINLNDDLEVISEESWIGKFFLKLDEETNKKKLFFKKADAASGNYTNLNFSDNDILVKSQPENATVTKYRVKNFLNFGTYGFITFNNDGKENSSVLLTHMMNENMTTKNPN